MGDCCASPATATHPKKHRCPANGQEYSEVSARTIAHHVQNSWNWEDSGTRYFFCDDPDCDVVYFGEDGSTILKSQLRTEVGVKEKNGSALICYCFGVSRDNASDAAIRDYVIRQTKQGACSCETSNPSGRCCLKDFPH